MSTSPFRLHTPRCHIQCTRIWSCYRAALRAGPTLIPPAPLAFPRRPLKSPSARTHLNVIVVAHTSGHVLGGVHTLSERCKPKEAPDDCELQTDDRELQYELKQTVEGPGLIHTMINLYSEGLSQYSY